jgi:molecular chaperone GrpE (heat shock protein)
MQSSDAEPNPCADQPPVPRTSTEPSTMGEGAMDFPDGEVTRQEADSVPCDQHDAGILLARVDALVAAVEQSNRLAEQRERTIDRLHEENQRLRQGELQQALAPVFRDLVRLCDLLQDVQAHAQDAGSTPDDLCRDLRDCQDLMTDVLYRHHVDRFEAQAGEPFDPKEHRALRAVVTDNSEQERRIARVIRCGFRQGSRILRPAEVDVYRYRATPAATPAPATAPPEAAANQKAA